MTPWLCYHVRTMNAGTAEAPELITPAPAHYTRAVRHLLCFALVMIVLGLLSGVAFQDLCHSCL
jgi:hypothetical protein